jgi:hypothetical protein
VSVILGNSEARNYGESFPKPNLAASKDDSRAGKVRLGQVGLGAAWLGRRGAVRHGLAWQGTARSGYAGRGNGRLLPLNEAAVSGSQD